MARFLIFGILGTVGSVVATCIMNIIATRKIDFTGHASLLLFPFWGLIALFYPLIAIRIGSLPWYGRGALLMAILFAFQYLVGLLLTKIGLCPWRYSGKASLGGLVRLADAPVFFIASFAIEWIYPFVKAAAAAIS